MKIEQGAELIVRFQQGDIAFLQAMEELIHEEIKFAVNNHLPDREKRLRALAYSFRQFSDQKRDQIVTTNG